MKTLATIAIITGIYIVACRLAPSWSQLADTDLQYLLYFCDGNIAFAFLWRSLKATNKNQYLFWNIKVTHLDFATAYFFLFVICFSVNSSIKWIENAHLISTALAILTPYLNIAIQQTEKQMKIASWTFLGVSFVLFIIGLKTDLYTVGDAEVLVSLMPLIYIWNTKTK